jgi:3',5'-cyclic AMP phosphodiesterase CpdA
MPRIELLNKQNDSVRSIKLPRHRLRSVATKIYNFYSTDTEEAKPLNPIKVVCISDTHNTQPELPPGDLLLHAGDLTEWGTFEELQSQLTWLSSQPHTHKVMIAGNHDVLLDRAFLNRFPDRYNDEFKAKVSDLNFGSVIYLQDSAVTLEFPDRENRKLRIYGSPTTPEYVASAFQNHGTRTSGVERCRMIPIFC